MMNRLIYVAPRAKKQRKKPVRIDAKPGPAALVANVIGLAVSDYICGDRRTTEDARWYFSSPEYQHHLEALGLPGDIAPAAIADHVVLMEID